MDRSGSGRGLRLSIALAALLIVALAWWSWNDVPTSGSVQTAATQRDLPPSVERERTEPQAGASLRGRVTDATKTALVGAQVCVHALRMDMLAAPSRCARTDGEGRYQLEELASGSYVVRASAQDHASGEAQLVLAAEQARVDFDFTLEQALANVRGTVRDALGGAVAGATVRIASAMPPQRAAATSTDQEGHFALHFSEGPVVVTASAEGYAADELATVSPAARLELTLAPAASIAGVVQLPNGKPAAGVEVRPADRGVIDVRSRTVTRSDEAGRFLLEGLPPGSYRLLARSAHTQGMSEESIELALGEALRDVVITVRPASRVLGKVQHKDSGEPCTQGTVMLSGMPDPMQPFPQEFITAGARPLPVPTQVAAIDGEGEVELLGVPAGTYYTVVRCDGHRLVEGPRQVAIEAQPVDVGPLEWSVVPAATLTVHTVDERGAPIGQQPLRMRVPAPAPGLGFGLLQMVTDAKGVVQVPDLRAGSYAIGPLDPRLGKDVEFELRDDRLALDVTVPLRGSAELVVTVVEADGRPVEELIVTATPVTQQADRPAAPQYAAALGEGRYRIQPLPPDTYRVEATDGVNPVLGGAGPDSQLRVNAGQQATLTLRVARSARITGRVTQPSGEPASDVWVSARAKEDGEGPLHRASTERARVLTDERGAFTLERLAPNAVYTVTARDPYGSEVFADGVAANGRVELKLPPTGRLSGRLQAADGRPERVHLARVTSADGRIDRVAHVSPDGQSFAINGLPVGEVTVLAASERGQVATRNVNVQAGDKPTLVELALTDTAGIQPGPHPSPTTEAPVRAD